MSNNDSVLLTAIALVAGGIGAAYLWGKKKFREGRATLADEIGVNIREHDKKVKEKLKNMYEK